VESFHVATFHSVSQALRFEKLLVQRGLDIKMIPVPRVISSSCGIAARFNDDDLQPVRTILEAGEAEAEGLYHLTYPGKRIQAEQLQGPWCTDS
jgi:hypothetical protein